MMNFIFKRKPEKELINACQSGDINSVREILNANQVDINYAGILIQK